ncbi:hypothetical protein EW146_g5123 [Bondarzewia mesenterica]|uniref:Beta-xylanase n=1 Tax=Bondarzewia mesenterica TaxID=1095465 RepID=A0A4V3XEX6_9AGAM|nr:hypothetical protein EW146_g5123 [Bondarzewia mesenterica]
MIKLAASVAALVAFVPYVVAQQAVWGQCGGIGWSGATTCVSGTTCTYSNDYYSQCIPNSSGGSSSSSSSASATSTSSAPGATSTAKLNTVAKAAGKKYFGSATDNPELTDTAYVAILSDSSQFGQITAGNSMKWDATEPSRGTFTFTQGDQIATLAKNNGQLLRGHNYSWDVVNEPFNDNGTWRADVFYNTLGTSYVTTALEAARSADPNTKVYINEYNLEYAGPKANAMLSLVESLQSAGTPIDGVGFQGHLIVGSVPSAIQSQLSAFTALGIEVAITELDIRMTLPATNALLAQQKTDYENVITACNAVSGCIGVTIWDYTDKVGCLSPPDPDRTIGLIGAALPWDANLVKKPAFDGIVAGFA